VIENTGATDRIHGKQLAIFYEPRADYAKEWVRGGTNLQRLSGGVIQVAAYIHRDEKGLRSLAMCQKQKAVSNWKQKSRRNLCY
jgi:hypothetical protein